MYRLFREISSFEFKQNKELLPPYPAATISPLLNASMRIHPTETRKERPSMNRSSVEDLVIRTSQWS